jgi:hypothetical protein
MRRQPEGNGAPRPTNTPLRPAKAESCRGPPLKAFRKYQSRSPTVPWHHEYRLAASCALDIVNKCSQPGDGAARYGRLRQVHTGTTMPGVSARNLRSRRARRIDQHAGLEFLSDAVCRQGDLDAIFFERRFDEVRGIHASAPSSRADCTNGARQQSIMGLRVVIADERVQSLGLKSIRGRTCAARDGADAHRRPEPAKQRVRGVRSLRRSCANENCRTPAQAAMNQLAGSFDVPLARPRFFSTRNALWPAAAAA